MEKQGKDKGEIALMIEEQRQVIPEVVEEPDYADSDPNAQYGGQFSFGDSIETIGDDAEPFPYDLDKEELEAEVRYSLGIEEYPE